MHIEKRVRRQREQREVDIVDDLSQAREANPARILVIQGSQVIALSWA